MVDDVADQLFPGVDSTGLLACRLYSFSLSVVIEITAVLTDGFRYITYTLTASRSDSRGPVTRSILSVKEQSFVIITTKNTNTIKVFHYFNSCTYDAKIA